MLLTAGLLLASCAKEGRDGEGRLRLQFSVDPTVAEQTTRALSLEAPDPSEFSLVIKKNGDPLFEPKEWDDLTQFPVNGLFLKTGTYTATASCGDPAEEGFDKPAFGTSGSFNITESRVWIEHLEARLVNMAVTVKYTEAFQGYFPEHYAVVGTAAGNDIAFRDDTAAGTAYIAPAAFDVEVFYTRQNGDEGSAVFEIGEETKGKDGKLCVGACKHLNIVIDVNAETGGVGNAVIKITFNEYVDEVNVPAIEVGSGD